MNPAGVPLAVDTVVYARRLRSAAPPAIHDLDLDILPGEIFAIVDRIVSGRTALFEALVGLRRVDADAFIVCGSDPRAFPAAVRERIGVAPRRAAVDRTLRVDEALALFASFYVRTEPLDALIEVLALSPYRTTLVRRLPPDAAQRLSLALALVNEPAVLFVEDPTRDLDPGDARRVWDLLRERRRRGRTVVVATGSLEEAERLADRVAIFDGGRLVAVDSPSVLLAQVDGRVLLTLELPRPLILHESLRALEGAVGVDVEGDRYAVWSIDGFATARSLIRLLDSLDVQPHTLTMRYPTLEDVFFRLLEEPRP
jgi:ABC-2 type transport system ATP-binding protein